MPLLLRSILNRRLLNRQKLLCFCGLNLCSGIQSKLNKPTLSTNRPNRLINLTKAYIIIFIFYHAPVNTTKSDAKAPFFVVDKQSWASISLQIRLRSFDSNSPPRES